MKKYQKYLLLFISVIIFLIFSILIYFSYISPVHNKVKDNLNQDIISKKINYIEYNDIPQTFKDAIVTIEDDNFYNHIGISPSSIVRAVVINIQYGAYKEGGSTITQQLIKNTLLTNEKTMRRKIQEAFLAISLSVRMSKEDILTSYINKIYYGNNAYGLNNASYVYFNKNPKELNDAELILLAGLPNAPSILDPTKNLDLAVDRQKKIIEKMVELNILTNEDKEKILSEPIRLYTYE